ncbi:hypothetical protein [Mycobacteroides abscessus]|uniref:hypothetical protein n=1 Tax=Mycobacteroides abscessus TaxID=36809 RepID=UPI000929FFC7|nr:hypothetical protein [Mycobacteroides abscessus]DAZ90369.1 TPA_asm: membrane protein [Mycobacterium phage prophiFSQJ01-1]SII41819.1 Uncharacterised protein [Mycobacteroides abscessus subsp. abscessus]SIK13271.1 Uncharacterised protein [Mycobacteroides abscessus subsp. abscessus]SIN25886.1 Uncharacterised protein [Mycobacteroides abscessus subsp. abscessus]SLI51056.1 Uncharacterised protein [Mycobacteroides abscessus subsp. abscessus]
MTLVRAPKMFTRMVEPRPGVLSQPINGVGKGSSAAIEAGVRITGKVSVTDDFSTLNKFTMVYGGLPFIGGDPFIDTGKLAGHGVVRHRVQALSDNGKATAVIGSLASGKTRLMIDADPLFNTFYGIEVETGIINNKLHIIKGRGNAATVTKHATVNVTWAASDQVAVWFDEAAETIRAYRNGTQISSLPVRRNEISHGPGFRHHGVAVGVDLFLGVINVGALFTSYAFADM